MPRNKQGGAYFFIPDGRTQDEQVNRLENPGRPLRENQNAYVFSWLTFGSAHSEPAKTPTKTHNSKKNAAPVDSLDLIRVKRKIWRLRCVRV